MKERVKNILIESKLTPQTSNIVTVQTKAHSLSEMKHERCNMNEIRDERMAIGSEKNGYAAVCTYYVSNSGNPFLKMVNIYSSLHFTLGIESAAQADSMGFDVPVK